MNPEDPAVAQQIVAAYAKLLEEYTETDRLPAPNSVLPYGRDTIKTAICTAARALTSNGQLTQDLREFLEGAYVGLADFIDHELARLMAEYNEAAAALSAGHVPTSERMKTPAWETLERTSALAGSIARSIAEDAEQLRAEFRHLATG